MKSGNPLTLRADFERVIALCEELEGTPISERLRHRIATAAARAIEKAMLVAWYKDSDLGDVGASNTSILRAAERGARDQA